jgi:PAS domain-containing protein
MNRKAFTARRLRTLGAVVLLASLAAGPLAAFEVNLLDYPLYVRVGFDANATDTVPTADDPSWQVFPPSPAGRMVRFVDLDLADVPRRSFLSFATHAPMEFTYLIAFPVSDGDIAAFSAAGGTEPPPVPGIHLAALGDNWEIFLNGRRVKSELHLDAAGRITAHRAHRDIMFPLAAGLLRPGSNVLAIRMVGDPTFPTLAMFHVAPYVLAAYDDLTRRDSEELSLVFIGLYLSIGLYHIFMYFIRRQDRYNLFYGLFSIVMGFYMFSRTHTIYRFIQDSQLIFHLEVGSLFWIIPLVGMFLEILSRNKLSLQTLVYTGVTVVFTLGMLFGPLPFGFDLLMLWEGLALIAVCYYFGYELIGRFATTGWKRWKRIQGGALSQPLGMVYLRELATSSTGNLLIGSVILFGTAIFDIVDAFALHWDLVLSQYGAFLFTMATALILANRMSFLNKQLFGLSQNLEKKIVDLEATTSKLAASERKYRSLFDGNSDAVALLDADLAIVEGNKAAADYFDLSGPARARRTLVDAVFMDEREGRLQVDRLRQVAADALALEGPQEISLRLKTPLGEAKAYRLRLEGIRSLGEREILLTAWPDAMDPLAAAFAEGREKFDIESSLSAADAVCRRIGARLERFMSGDDATFLMICLREIVINAIEHGNLKIGFAEKTAAQQAGNYFDLLQRRLRQAPYRDRKVSVEYSISAAKATIRVTDEGDGFDHKKFRLAGDEPDPSLLEHGRGLFMTLSAFDQVAYNDKGNQVTLVKAFAGSN